MDKEKQPSPGDWEPVFARVREELERAVQMKRDGRWPPPALDSSQPADS